MSEHLESFKKFLNRRVKTSDAYLSGDAEPFLEIYAEKSPATFFSPGGDYVEGAKKVAATHESGAQTFGSFDPINLRRFIKMPMKTSLTGSDCKNPLSK